MLADSPANCLFLTWQWLDAWLQARVYQPELLIVCVRDGDGELLGAAPLYKTEYRLIRVFPYRALRIIGDVDSGAEYQTWIARRDCEAEACAEMVKALRSLQREWDLLWMPRLNSWSKSQQCMLDELHNGGLRFNRRANSFSAIDLPTDFSGYLASLSANRRQQIRRMTNRILSKPNVCIRKITSHRELATALEALFRLHGMRWKAAGQLGVFASRPLEKAFYEHFAPRALDAGWLALYMLCDNDEPKAVQLGYIYDSVFLQLQEGFDPDYCPHVVNVLRAHVIQDCIRKRVREYDFLGGVTEHKRRWLARQRIGEDVLIAAPGLKTYPIMRGHVWPTGAWLRTNDTQQRIPQAQPVPARSPDPASVLPFTVQHARPPVYVRARWLTPTLSRSERPLPASLTSSLYRARTLCP